MFMKEKKLLEENVASLYDLDKESESIKPSYNQEKRFQDIVSCSLDLIWEVNKNGIYAYVSGRVEDLPGFTPHEVVGKKPLGSMSPHEVEKIRNVVHHNSPNREPIKGLKNWNVTKNGKNVCFLTNAVLLLDDQGNFKGYRGVDKDITEREEIEEKLKISEKHSRLVAESLPIGVFEVDDEGRIVYTNTKWQEIFGTPLEESVDMTIADMFYEDREEVAG